MAKGKKTSPEVIYKIMISWAITHSYSQTARDLDMAESTVEKIVKDNKDKDEFVKLCAEKKDEFAEKATRIINRALERLEEELTNDEKEIPINHLTTAIGTLYDKRALANGESTENTKITFELPPEVDKYAE